MSGRPAVPDLLSIGISTGGMSPANQLTEEALAGFMRLVISERENFPNGGLRINIVFHIPGPLFQPDYEGVHATRLDRKRQHLLVVAAVPPALPVDQVSSFVADVLRQTRRTTAAYLAKRKIRVDTASVTLLIDHLIEMIEAPAP